MRIRKIVSKLLGSAMAYPSHHLSPYPDLSAPTAMDFVSSDLFCQLNQSPWDIYPNLHLFNTDFQDLESLIISKKEEAEVEVLETKEETQNVISENTGTISENTGGISENSNNPIRVCQKKISRSPRKKKEKMKKKNAIILCKKNDGKKWFCKRPAHLPQSLCEYHLSQSRSYYNTNKEKDAIQYHVKCEVTKRNRKLRENGGSAVNPYYYYNGFGPVTWERRGRMNDGGGSRDTMLVAVEERLDICDVLDDTCTVDEESDEEIAGELVSDPNDEENRHPRKQRRKPVKCRSLKSLL